VQTSTQKSTKPSSCIIQTSAVSPFIWTATFHLYLPRLLLTSVLFGGYKAETDRETPVVISLDLKAHLWTGNPDKSNLRCNYVIFLRKCQISYNFRQTTRYRVRMGVDHHKAYLWNVYKYTDTEWDSSHVCLFLYSFHDKKVSATRYVDRGSRAKCVIETESAIYWSQR
jgi:hypothetical protein